MSLDGVRGRREAQEGGDICMFMADSHFCIAKPTLLCKAIILQLKINKSENESCSVISDSLQARGL